MARDLGREAAREVFAKTQRRKIVGTRVATYGRSSSQQCEASIADQQRTMLTAPKAGCSEAGVHIASHVLLASGDAGVSGVGDSGGSAYGRHDDARYMHLSPSAVEEGIRMLEKGAESHRVETDRL